LFCFPLPLTWIVQQLIFFHLFYFLPSSDSSSIGDPSLISGGPQFTFPRFFDLKLIFPKFLFSFSLFLLVFLSGIRSMATFEFRFLVDPGLFAFLGIHQFSPPESRKLRPWRPVNRSRISPSRGPRPFRNSYAPQQSLLWNLFQFFDL